MLKRVGAVLALAVIVGCASFGGARHGVTVSVVSVHQTLAAVQDTEMLLVCGRTSALLPPACIPIEQHRQISARLSRAFDLDGQVATIVRDTPIGAPQPSQVASLIGEIIGLTQTIIADLPDSPAKRTLTQNIQGVK